MWRKSDNTDAMYEECIGPSCYSKGQGIPVRVCGVLACGVLHIEILEEGEVMNACLYSDLVEEKFEEWCGHCEYLVCDFEGCIRGEEALHALDNVGLQLVEGYPRTSQDLNAIENAWDILKKRLDETMPVRLERRDDFEKRLKLAVAWVSRNRADQLRYPSTNQKERASDCLAQKPPGGRTKW